MYWRLNNLDGLHTLSSNPHQWKISCPLILNKASNKAKAQTVGPLPYNTQWCGFNGRFPFNSKFRKFRMVHQMERTISGIFGTSFEGGPLWPVQLSRSVGPKYPFPFDKSVVPSTALLYSATKRAVAWVRSLQPGGTVPLGMWNFRNFKPEFLLNGKRPTSFTYKKNQRGLDDKANDLMLGPMTWSSELRQNLNQRPLLSRISSVGRACDCWTGGRGFYSRDRTITQGLKISEKWRYLPLHCKRQDLRVARMTTLNGGPVPCYVSPISTFVLNILILK